MPPIVGTSHVANRYLSLKKRKMIINQNIIKKRQEFYWLGRKFADENNLLKAIEAYKTYSTYLSDEDKHIPQQWIFKFYEDLGEVEKSLYHLEEFAKGCTPPKAAEVFKEVGEKFLKINLIERAKINFENAIEKNPNIGVKKKLKELKNGLL